MQTIAFGVLEGCDEVLVVRSVVTGALEGFHKCAVESFEVWKRSPLQLTEPSGMELGEIDIDSFAVLFEFGSLECQGVGAFYISCSRTGR